MITSGSKVKMNLVGTLDDGRVICNNAIEGGIPFEFTLGAGEMLPALEQFVFALEPGAHERVLIPAKDAFGVVDPTMKESVSVEDIPFADQLVEGSFVNIRTADGIMRFKVESISNGFVTFDYNHEFAGHDVWFDIELLKVLPAQWTPIEREAYYETDRGECGCKQLLGRAGAHVHTHTCACHSNGK